jgi:phage shock protein B
MKLAGVLILLLVVLAIASAGLAILGASFFYVKPSPTIGMMSSAPPPPVAYGPQTSSSWAHVLMNFGGLIALLSILLVVLVVALFAAMRFMRGGQRKLRSDREHLQETVMIQEIHAGLSRMEDRIEALETILFDRAAPSASGHARPKAGRSV